MSSLSESIDKTWVDTPENRRDDKISSVHDTNALKDITIIDDDHNDITNNNTGSGELGYNNSPPDIAVVSMYTV